MRTCGVQPFTNSASCLSYWHRLRCAHEALRGPVGLGVIGGGVNTHPKPLQRLPEGSNDLCLSILGHLSGRPVRVNQESCTAPAPVSLFYRGCNMCLDAWPVQVLVRGRQCQSGLLQSVRCGRGAMHSVPRRQLEQPNKPECGAVPCWAHLKLILFQYSYFPRHVNPFLFQSSYFKDCAAA